MLERLLIRYPIFELLEAVLLQALLDEAVPLAFEAGDIVFQEGSAGAWVHFLLEGRVRILRRSESGAKSHWELCGIANSSVNMRC